MVNVSNIESFFLVTTSDESTWPVGGKIIFLGEWCRLHSRKSFWQNIDSKVMPYHWDDRSKLESDYKYLIILYERILIELVPILNQLHKVNLTNNAWRIILGPWLGCFLQICYDRWYMIKLASATYSNLNTIILEFNDRNCIVPNDMSSFIEKFTNDKWNHFIYSEIIPSFNINVEKIKDFSINESVHNLKFANQLKHLAKKFFNKIVNKLNGDNSVLLYNTYLNLFDAIKLSFYFKQIPVFPTYIKSKQYYLNNKFRSWELIRNSNDTSFEVFIKKIIPKQIPLVYLEGFSNIYSKIQFAALPKNPPAIFTSNSIYEDEFFKFYTAQKTDLGAKLFIGQHGGHYGIGKFYFNEYHELKISDIFFSWGWNSSNEPKIHKLGILTTKSLVKSNYRLNNKILFISTTVPRYSYSIFSLFISSQWLGYFDMQIDFIKNLKAELRGNLIIRLFKNDFNWSQLDRWKKVFPSLIYDVGVNNIERSIKKSKLVVSTYNATAFLESLSMNIPTIVFWDVSCGEIRESAIPFFRKLKNVNIFHTNAKSAATHLNNVWGNIEAWWENDVTQNVVKEFTSSYCNYDPDIAKNITIKIKSTSAF